MFRKFTVHNILGRWYFIQKAIKYTALIASALFIGGTMATSADSVVVEANQPSVSNTYQ